MPAMQRLYAMFPAGRAGVGLLLLRIVVALQLMAVGSACSRPLMGPMMGPLMGWLVLGLAVLLCIGVLTPLLALLAVGLALCSLFSHWPALQPLLAMYGLIIANAIALALLGPGAYALDARWFGRRLILVRAAGAAGTDPDDEIPDETLEP